MKIAFNPVIAFAVSCLATVGLTRDVDAAEINSPTLKKIAESGVISLGHRTSSIPFSYYDDSQKVVGFSQDLCDKIVGQVKRAVRKSDLQVRMVPVTSQNRISLVQNGTIDLECGVTTNLKSRQEQVAFSTTFFVAGTRLLVKADSPIKDFSDLAGKAVVTNAGTTSERILRKMNDEKKPAMRIQSAKDYGESFLVLESGRVSAFMMDDVLLSGVRTTARTPDDWKVVGPPQSFEAYGFMMRKDDPEFKRLVDETLQGVMKSGEINALYAKWFMSPIPPRNANFNFPMSDELKKLYAEPNDRAFE